MKARRCSKKLYSIKLGRAEMGVTQAELSKDILEPYDVVLFCEVPGLWRMELNFASGKVLDVQTRRGPVKIWRSVDDALTFIGEYCPGAKSITCHGNFGTMKAKLAVTIESLQDSTEKKQD